jgi:hypothetical protein
MILNLHDFVQYIFKKVAMFVHLPEKDLEDEFESKNEAKLYKI